LFIDILYNLYYIKVTPQLEISFAQSSVLVRQASSSHESREIRARLDVPLIPHPFFPLFFLSFFFTKRVSCLSPKTPRYVLRTKLVRMTARL